MSADIQKRARELNLSIPSIRVKGQVVQLTQLDPVELAAFKLQFPQIVLDPAKEAKPKPKKQATAPADPEPKETQEP